MLAALLSLPQPDGIPPLTSSPQKQKEKTQEALVAWLMERQEGGGVLPVCGKICTGLIPRVSKCSPSSCEQVPTSRMLAVLTYRPDFTPPWRPRSHITQLTLSRLGQQHVDSDGRASHGQSIAAEVIQQIVSKTDGVPLFVEELTKLCWSPVREAEGRYVGTC